MSQSFLSKAMGKIAQDEKSIVDSQPQPEVVEKPKASTTKVPTNKARISFKQQQLQSLANGGINQNGQ